MGAVYRLTLRQLSGRWRILIMTVLSALPIAITLLVLSFDDAPSVPDFEKVVLSTMLAGAIAPLIVLAIAGGEHGEHEGLDGLERRRVHRGRNEYSQPEYSAAARRPQPFAACRASALELPKLAQASAISLRRVEPLDDSLESVFGYLVEG